MSLAPIALGVILLLALASSSADGKSSASSAVATAAKKLADNVRAKGYDYARSLCSDFQKLASIPIDGIYGPETVKALSRFVADPPKALFVGAKTTTTPPKATTPQPATATKAPVAYVAPGSAPKGATQPGTPPKGAVKPGPTLTVSTPKIRPATAAEKAAAKQSAKTPAKGPPPLPVVPASSVRASPELEPHLGSLPAGYDPQKARAAARATAAHLAKKGPAGYSRPQLTTWQRQAGLSADGLYGGSTRGALIYYGVADPPRPFAAPTATLPYVPPEKRV